MRPSCDNCFSREVRRHRSSRRNSTQNRRLSSHQGRSVLRRSGRTARIAARTFRLDPRLFAAVESWLADATLGQARAAARPCALTVDVRNRWPRRTCFGCCFCARTTAVGVRTRSVDQNRNEPQGPKPWGFLLLELLGLGETDGADMVRGHKKCRSVHSLDQGAVGVARADFGSAIARRSVSCSRKQSLSHKGKPPMSQETDPHFRHHAARRRAIARREHEPGREDGGRPGPGRPGRRRHRGRLSHRLAGRLRGGPRHRHEHPRLGDLRPGPLQRRGHRPRLGSAASTPRRRGSTSSWPPAPSIASSS